MTAHLMYLSEPPASYAKLSDHSTVQHAVDWLNAHLKGDFVCFNNTSLPGNPEHHARPSQFAILSKGEFVFLKHEANVISQRGEE